MAVFHLTCPIPESHNLLVAVLVASAHDLPFRKRLVSSRRNSSHDRPSLFRKVHGGADENHGFNSVRLHRSHMEKSISSHAQTDGAALPDAKMIQKSQGVQGALAMGNRLARIGAPTVAASVRQNQRVFTRKLFATRMGPIFLAASAPM